MTGRTLADRIRAAFGQGPRSTRPLTPAGPWTPTHRHKKGGLYRVLAAGTYEADRSAVTIYDDAQGQIWVRSSAEFDDGRFTPLP